MDASAIFGEEQMTNEQKPPARKRIGWLDMLGIALALVAFLAAIKRMSSLESVDVAFGWITLAYLAASAFPAPCALRHDQIQFRSDPF